MVMMMMMMRIASIIGDVCGVFMCTLPFFWTSFISHKTLTRCDCRSVLFAHFAIEISVVI